MPKVYKITGESRTRPESLPAGFTVEEEERSLPIIVGAAGAWSLHTIQVHRDGESTSGGEGYRIEFREGDRPHHSPLLYVEESALRELRNKLNEFFGESEDDERTPYRHRVLRDGAGYLWFEVLPESFRLAWDWNEAFDSRSRPRSAATIDDKFGPVDDITDIHPARP